MNKIEFKKLIRDQFKRIEELTASKGEEYSQSSDQLANFRRQSWELDLPAEKVLLVYLNKHLDSIRAYATHPDSATMSEPIDGRIDDAILYLLLLKAMVVERREGVPVGVEPARAHPPVAWSWKVLEEEAGTPVVLRVAGRHFDMAFTAGSEQGQWLADQLRSAMERLTAQLEAAK
jgi:hypothetical protein